MMPKVPGICDVGPSITHWDGVVPPGTYPTSPGIIKFDTGESGAYSVSLGSIDVQVSGTTGCHNTPITTTWSIGSYDGTVGRGVAEPGWTRLEGTDTSTNGNRTVTYTWNLTRAPVKTLSVTTQGEGTVDSSAQRYFLSQRLHAELCERGDRHTYAASGLRLEVRGVVGRLHRLRRLLRTDGSISLRRCEVRVGLHA